MEEKQVDNHLSRHSNTHKLIVNVSPITRYHSLLCPSVNNNLPQWVTEDSLRLVLEVMFLAQDRNLRIGFNSLCAMASVNHLHYHLFLENHDLPVENIKCTQIKGPLYAFDETYPIPAFCFEVPSPQSINGISKEIYKLIEHLLKNCIAHNIFITRGSNLVPGEQNLEIIRIIIWPRKSSPKPKILTTFYVGLCELSGWFPVYSQNDYDKLRTDDLEIELSKWKIDNFSRLCDQVGLLY
ncbi:GDP-D-glucose phosphorylase 1 [Hyposmocoma kahamanoa]|uniref:GDP-D-glucose phosphorylase 1 n=1 Tax=Hyposmocoma kahamanoa TaxID=1477025 RepID=UPI000E6D99A1|nr:GDP-D-glucose phosphorylase 1 [Hyposmocoma kahamanoa]